MFRGIAALSAFALILFFVVRAWVTLTADGGLMLAAVGVVWIILDGLWDRAQAEREAVRRA